MVTKQVSGGARAEDEPPRVLLESPLHVLRRALQASTAAWQRTISDVTPPQFAVLCVLEDEHTIDQSRMGRLTGIDPATLAPLITRLEERDLLRRDTDPADRRRKLLYRTDAGARLVATVLPMSDRVNEEILAGLETNQREIFFETLRHIGVRATDC